MASLAATVALLVVAYARRPRAGRTPPRLAVPATMLHPVRRRLGRAQLGAREREFADAIELVVLAVRAGYLPAAALHAATAHVAGSLRPAFAEVTRRTGSGQRFADALSALTENLGPMAAPLADSFAAADRYGLPVAPVLERLGHDARQRRRRQAETLARQLPVRMALPLVLCTLPAFVLLAVVPLLLAALSSLHR